MDNYFEMDGYSLFYRAIETLQEEGQLIPIKNNQYNGKTPALALILLGKYKSSDRQMGSP